jgi:hypothetical protein
MPARANKKGLADKRGQVGDSGRMRSVPFGFESRTTLKGSALAVALEFGGDLFVQLSNRCDMIKALRRVAVCADAVEFIRKAVKAFRRTPLGG